MGLWARIRVSFLDFGRLRFLSENGVFLPDATFFNAYEASPAVSLRFSFRYWVGVIGEYCPKTRSSVR